jgi:hypothetical protein
VYDRGKKAKGYHVIVSLHSNAVNSSRDDATDYPVIYKLTSDTGLGATFASELVAGIAKTMKTK